MLYLCCFCLSLSVSGMGKLLWYVLAIFALPCLSEGAKILLVFPFPSRSHNILGEGFNRILLKAGHEVTYITPFPKKDAPSNLHYVDVSGNLDSFPAHLSNLKSVIDKEISPNNIKEFFLFLTNLSKITFENVNVQKLINDPNQKFDLVIVEWMFSEIYAGLAAIYDCPYIWFSSVEPHWIVLSLIDEALNPAYNPDCISSNIPPFNFLQRVEELGKQVVMSFLRNVYLLPYERNDYSTIFGPIMARKGQHLPSFDDMRFNASLMFGNSHVSFGKATRLPQNFIPIGGYHIDPDVKPLPQDLKKLMDDANNGVVYFSMGSNLKSKDLPEKIKRSLLTMFGGLKYTVIWKFEEQLNDVPKNVHILQWAPQPSILAHPNCKVFVTHGGLLSTTEAIHFGMPTIGIPVLADQNTNVELSVKRGYALKVGLDYEMADNLKVAIEEIVSNPKYKEKVMQLNFVYHDRPVPPETEVAHWVNHVIRTNGAPHLRSAALMVSWYQKMYLDLLALVFFVIYVFVKICKKVCCSRKQVEKVTKKVGKGKKNK
ncbi:UDP-glucosyltransferase 2-like isoform X2 [Pectinophora gossypiella]|uniref:UDP-glucosyltransferase 2-like isoform X2 n=1 Tax=Pectinophora gossypiella TaxID=13191 RepID=UPI00214E6785|nr:UDP-glucosyltransferase 2-like isoform X2 [Pectinophora gossypiella]